MVISAPMVNVSTPPGKPVCATYRLIGTRGVLTNLTVLSHANYIGVTARAQYLTNGTLLLPTRLV